MSAVSKVYGTGLVQSHALRQLDLQVRSGEFVAVMGPSGSGKTTLLNIAGLLESFDEGEYWLDGEAVGGLSDAALSRLRNEKIGFVFQSFNLIADLDVYENIELPLRYRGLSGGDRARRVTQALERSGLAARSAHRPAQLSGGQQQRVAIARALVGGPKLLLADEPTGNLDSLAAAEVMHLLDAVHRQGTTVVMVTHSPELARRAQRTIYLLDGQLTDFGDTAELAGVADLIRAG